MLSKEDVVSYCLALPGAYEDHPFHDDTAVLRHKGNRKGFVFLITAKGRLHINVKCEPLRSQLLRRVYPEGVVPAYHMNKEHWNTVFAKGVPTEEVFRMIDMSYELTRPGPRRKGSR